MINMTQSPIEIGVVSGKLANRDRIANIIDVATSKQVGVIIYYEPEGAYIFSPSVLCVLVPTVLEAIALQLRILNSILYLGKEWLNA